MLVVHRETLLGPLLLLDVTRVIMLKFHLAGLFGWQPSG